MPQQSWHPEKGAKPDHVIHLNCGEVRTHANYKTTRTWKNFNNGGTKLILLSDKLWLMANNSRVLWMGVSQCKLSALKFALFRTLETLSSIWWYKNIDLARKGIWNKLMIFRSDKKYTSWIPRICLKRIRGKYALFSLGNNKNNVIADKVSTYF